MSYKNFFKNILALKVPYYLAFIIIAGIVSGFFFFVKNAANTQANSPTDSLITNLEKHDFRSKGPSLTRPLIFVEGTEDSPELISMKNDIQNFINQNKNLGTIEDASVFYKSLTTGNLININGGVLYSPGSLMKVPVMMTLLKEAEMNPKLLNTKIDFRKHYQLQIDQTYTGEPLVENRAYTINDLLYYLIVYSDNDADVLLGQKLDFKVLEKVFEEAGLPAPAYGQMDYLTTVKDYSRFFNVLYNSSCLNHPMSEYALSLLTKTAYKEGFLKAVDSTTLVAHKFGERGNQNKQELHEVGIVYLNNDPYLVGIMTKGSDRNKLPFIISEISRIIYKDRTKIQVAEKKHS